MEKGLTLEGLEYYTQQGIGKLYEKLYTGTSTDSIELITSAPLNASLKSPEYFIMVEDKYRIPVGTEALYFTVYSDARFTGATGSLTVWLIDPDTRECKLRKDFNNLTSLVTPGRSGRRFEFNIMNPDTTKNWVWAIGGIAQYTIGAITTNASNPTATGPNLVRKGTNFGSFFEGNILSSLDPNFNFYPSLVLEYTAPADIPKLQHKIEGLEVIAAEVGSYQVRETTTDQINFTIQNQDQKYFNINYIQPDALGFRNYCNFTMSIQQGTGNPVDAFKIQVRHGGNTYLIGENAICLANQTLAPLRLTGVGNAVGDYDAMNRLSVKQIIKDVVAASTDWDDFKQKIADW